MNPATTSGIQRPQSLEDTNLLYLGMAAVVSAGAIAWRGYGCFGG